MVVPEWCSMGPGACSVHARLNAFQKKLLKLALPWMMSHLMGLLPPPRAPGRLLVCMLAFPRGDSGSTSPLHLFPVDEGFMLSCVLSAGLRGSACADWPVPMGFPGKDCHANCVFPDVPET